jgi:hypothetical protein
MKKSELIHQLIEQTKHHILIIKGLKTKDITILTGKSDDHSWSVLECIEHLCRYADYYLPVISKAIQHANVGHEDSEFHSGWLGNYFAESMLPNSPKSKKMDTFKSMNPRFGELRKDVLIQFENQLQEIIILLEQSRNKKALQKRIPISISKLIRIKTGDAFRFVINHHERHLQQALKAEKHYQATQ